ncbi:DUF4344 domain-containing metallopeptidase [Vibrio genomosp. F10]|uniref:DUF4344 domain-containing metallopeptidase n=1 Tax=Vibrio genomosp. F10 TaxID=723171 RepID=UPI0002DF8075|nr:DUF4344 domain-containing metallopeptidase [Vibrio genomosp. F10]OEF04195.1 hypothetical protein A1QK_10170 [Vibrio genomosp. F10 str. 9ZD137]
MHDRILSVLAAALLMVSTPLAAKDSITIDYLTPATDQDKHTQQAIKESGINELISELAHSHFPFNKPLVIQYGSEDGPLYDPELHQVSIPYPFYQQSLQYFTKNDYQKRFNKPAQQGAIDTLFHTLLHEAGHAYIHDQKIPILGKEEDAVDNFATIMLIEYIDNGADVAISAADMFAFESDDRPDYYDFGEYIDEHSFDLQRYFSTLCLVYGSDPKTHQNLLNEVEPDYLSERQEFCEFEYHNLSQNWHSYLGQDRQNSKSVTD